MKKLFIQVFVLALVLLPLAACEKAQDAAESAGDMAGEAAEAAGEATAEGMEAAGEMLEEGAEALEEVTGDEGGENEG